MQIEEIQELCRQGKIKWSTHCLERIMERDISRADVKNGILNGEIIEDYQDDFPHPSCLIFGCLKDARVIHIVVGSDTENIYIITAYYPNTTKFESDLKTRRRS